MVRRQKAEKAGKTEKAEKEGLSWEDVDIDLAPDGGSESEEPSGDDLPLSR